MSLPSVLAFLTIFAEPSLAGEFSCTSRETCSTEIGCEKQIVQSYVSVNEDENTVLFGSSESSRNTWIEYQITPNSQRTLVAGVGGPQDQIGAQSLVIFKTLEFVLTSAVEIEFDDKKKSVGILVRGNCERIAS